MCKNKRGYKKIKWVLWDRVLIVRRTCSNLVQDSIDLKELFRKRKSFRNCRTTFSAAIWDLLPLLWNFTRRSNSLFQADWNNERNTLYAVFCISFSNVPVRRNSSQSASYFGAEDWQAARLLQSSDTSAEAYYQILFILNPFFRNL